MEIKSNKVIFTRTIPQCPHCNIPTIRVRGMSSRTAAYYAPTYNEKGENINPDKNTMTTHYQCLNCNSHFAISGNHINGYEYKL